MPSTAPATLLVIDDEPNIPFTISETLGSPNLRVVSASTAREGIRLAGELRPDVVLLDIRLPDLSGLDAFQRIHEIDSRIPIIMMTAFARTETAIEAMARGAFEYLVKPVQFTTLRDVVSRALQVARLSRVPAIPPGAASEDSVSADQIVGLSPAMQDVYKAIGRVALQDSTVLILGESGTGKEMVARSIYHFSSRAGKPFLAVNCAALSDALLESELFGHERGAFTGADQRRIGKFEQVNGGTILLDEIGDMSAATQAKALRLLQQQQFERVGGNETIQTDVRIIAATNHELQDMVSAGRFRQDLYYRLQGFTIRLPALRERREDVPLLTDHFIALYNRDQPKKIRAVTDETRAVLAAHDWPGNVREFNSAIRYAMAQAATDVLTPDCLPESCRCDITRASVSVSFIKASPSVAARPVDPPGISRSNFDPTGSPDSGSPARSHRDEDAFLGGSVTAPMESAASHDSTATPPSVGTLDVAELTRRLLRSGVQDVYREIITAVDQTVCSETMQFFHNNQLQAAERLGISRMTRRSKLRSSGLTPGSKQER